MRISEIRSLGVRFENLAKEIFRRHGFDVTEANFADMGADFFIESKTHKKAAVEVKLYRTLYASQRNLLRAIRQVEKLRQVRKITAGIVITNSRIDKVLQDSLENHPNIRVYDFDLLWGLGEGHPDLLTELDQITREALIFRGGDLPLPEPQNADDIVSSLNSGLEGEEGPEQPIEETPNFGKDLCEEIRNVPEGKGKPFEIACDNAIRYLFDGELINWDDQYSSHGKMHRYDLIARVASSSDFWKVIVNDFRARYIIFEFKNYKKKISQREVYITEKYLYPVATRGAAILVSRHGENKSANSAMRGALRDTGKLILSLSVDEVCEMLRAKDLANDHLEILVNKLDEMLMGLER